MLLPCTLLLQCWIKLAVKEVSSIIFKVRHVDWPECQSIRLVVLPSACNHMICHHTLAQVPDFCLLFQCSLRHLTFDLGFSSKPAGRWASEHVCCDLWETRDSLNLTIGFFKLDHPDWPGLVHPYIHHRDATKALCGPLTTKQTLYSNLNSLWLYVVNRMPKCSILYTEPWFCRSSKKPSP